jgi:Mn-dependent DtxR family transcriptional regulator
MNISKTNLAALLNVERPSLSFEVKKLIREGVIKNKNKDYTILDLNKILKEI